MQAIVAMMGVSFGENAVSAKPTLRLDHVGLAGELGGKVSGHRS